MTQFGFEALQEISIHAPVKGATLVAWMDEKFVIYFNPRSRKGSDLIDELPDDDPIIISIHAPVKGATIILGV